ncbi:S26 family signal peptidase [Streptomyces sp. NPDC048751]|uniref:S26 family signal peptidase n=1 Tax=Streptomyces sp. NPDC048751 TaxID=3365591 RepID=UPI00371AF894
MFERMHGDEVRQGNVVLYSAPERFQSDGGVMHRVIGVGGDHSVCCAREKVPEGRLFVLGDHRANAMDSRLFADDHEGTVPVGAVKGRVTDDVMVPVLLGLAGLLGGVVALAGLGLGIAALVVRRRRPVPVRPPVPTRV